MNMVEAMRDTLKLARDYGMDNVSSDNSELDYAHLVDMLQRVEEAEDAGTPFSEGKKGRWLGWIQAAVVANGFGPSLNDMKEINKKWAS